MSKKGIDVSALCHLSKLNMSDAEKARLSDELEAFASLARVLDEFDSEGVEFRQVAQVSARADTPRSFDLEMSGRYVTVPLTVAEAQND